MSIFLKGGNWMGLFRIRFFVFRDSMLIFLTLNQNISFFVFLRLRFDRPVPKDYIFSYHVLFGLRCFCIAPRSCWAKTFSFLVALCFVWCCFCIAPRSFRTKCFCMLLILLEYFPPNSRTLLVLTNDFLF